MTEYEFTIECFHLNSREELESALMEGPTQSDLDNSGGLTETQWVDAVKHAIRMLDGDVGDSYRIAR